MIQISSVIPVIIRLVMVSIPNRYSAPYNAAPNMIVAISALSHHGRKMKLFSLSEHTLTFPVWPLTAA